MKKIINKTNYNLNEEQICKIANTIFVNKILYIAGNKMLAIVNDEAIVLSNFSHPELTLFHLHYI